MPWTKQQLIEQAFAEIGRSKYIFTITPDELQDAARMLDSMMATWNNKGIRVSYPISSDPSNIELDQVTNVPDAANMAIFKNLAIQLAPSYGKPVSQELKVSAKDAYDGLLSRAVSANIKQLPANIPLGAGNKGISSGYGRVFTSPPCDDLPID